jgi:arylsulfatase A-like enzyme
MNSAMFSLLMLLPLAVPAATDSEAAKPNIVLVMADDQGWGDAACYGHPKLKTPEMDSLAADGLKFERFYAAAPVCSPTRGSVMTGRHPNRFGCFCWGYPLRPQEITIAEALKTAGYATGHFGKWHLGSVRRGSPVNPGASGFDRWFSAPNFFDNDPVMSDEGTAVPTKGESSMVTVDAAIKWIRKEADAKQPFLAVVWFGSPHGPHKALDSDREQYKDEPERFQHFYGEITAMDRAIGKLRREIKDLGIKENTVFWYCSDNGALPRVGSSGGHRGWKGKVYEGGLLVPSMIEWPARIKKPRVTDVPCCTYDIYPTVLDIVGVKMKNQPPLDGVSLLPLIDGEMTRREKPLGFWRYAARGVRTPSKQWMGQLLAAQRAGEKLDKPEQLRLDAGEIKKHYAKNDRKGHAAWVDGDWKLHRIVEGKKKGVRYELYNLAKDRREKKNLIDVEPERAEKMKAGLEAWQQSVIDSLNGEDYPKE